MRNNLQDSFFINVWLTRLFLIIFILFITSNGGSSFIQNNFNPSIISTTFSQAPSVLVNSDKSNTETVLATNKDTNSNNTFLSANKLTDLLDTMKKSPKLKVNDIVKGFRVTSIMGPRNIQNCPQCSRYHRGIDLAMPTGVPLAAPGLKGQNIKITKENQKLGGIVCRVFYEDSVSKQVFPVVYTYAHMSKCNEGKYTIPTIVGFSGNTGGATTGPHLHLGMTISGNLVQPDRVSITQILDTSFMGQ